jgi:hypothetical protein
MEAVMSNAGSQVTSVPVAMVSAATGAPDVGTSCVVPTVGLNIEP